MTRGALLNFYFIMIFFPAVNTQKNWLQVYSGSYATHTLCTKVALRQNIELWKKIESSICDILQFSFVHC